MEKRGIAILQNQRNRAPVVRVPQVQPNSRTLQAQQQEPSQSSNSSSSDNKVVIIQNFYQEAPVSPPPVEVAYYPPMPRNLCPPPFAPPFAFYPAPCSMQQPKPFCFN